MPPRVLRFVDHRRELGERRAFRESGLLSLHLPPLSYTLYNLFKPWISICISFLHVFAGMSFFLMSECELEACGPRRGL